MSRSNPNRPFKVVADTGCLRYTVGTFATRERAEARAKQIADTFGYTVTVTP